MFSISMRARLLGGVAAGLGAALLPQQALAGCVTTSVQNPNDGIVCDTSGPSHDSWDGQNVFDVRSKAEGKGLDGRPYSEW